LILAIGLRGEANGPAARDFIAYWSSGQLLLRRANPYSASEVLIQEKAAGYQQERPLIMRNPPWALVLALPLGFFTAYWGALAWILSIVACIMCSTRIIWTVHGSPPDRIHLLGYVFAPTIACVMSAQAAAFAALGATLFFSFFRKRPWVAGLGGALMITKPHLFLLVWPWLLIDSVRRRQFRFLLGFAGYFLAAVLIVLLLQPGIFGQYLAMGHSAGIHDEFIPAF